jgi:hypothetical protein
LTTQQHGEHHITIPDHTPLRAGTLAAVLGDVAQYHNLTRDQLIRLLFSRK